MDTRSIQRDRRSHIAADNQWKNAAERSGVECWSAVAVRATGDIVGRVTAVRKAVADTVAVDKAVAESDCDCRLAKLLVFGSQIANRLVAARKLMAECS